MKVYTVKINGLEHTLQLSDEDAERYGKAAVEVKPDPAENKARRAATKDAGDTGASDPAEA